MLREELARITTPRLFAGIEADEAVVAAGLTVVPGDWRAERTEREPRQTDAHAGLIGVADGGVRMRQGAGRATAGRIQIRREELQHVVGGRSQRARAGEGGQIPVPDDCSGVVMTESEVRHHRRRERDSRVVHPERLEYSLGHERLVALAGAKRENVTKESHAEIRVLELGSDVARQLVAERKSYSCWTL